MLGHHNKNFNYILISFQWFLITDIYEYQNYIVQSFYFHSNKRNISVLSILGVVLFAIIITLLLKWRKSQGSVRYSLITASFSSDHRWDDTEVMIPT